jgi:hypothetical protein
LGLRPKPRDLSLSARLAGSLLAKQPGCRTLEEPRRKTGPRRDATRAPREVRTDGAAPMPPSEPAATHLRIGQKLSKLWGPPQPTGIPPQSKGLNRHYTFGRGTQNRKPVPSAPDRQEQAYSAPL